MPGLTPQLKNVCDLEGRDDKCGKDKRRACISIAFAFCISLPKALELPLSSSPSQGYRPREISRYNRETPKAHRDILIGVAIDDDDDTR